MKNTTQQSKPKPKPKPKTKTKTASQAKTPDRKGGSASRSRAVPGVLYPRGAGADIGAREIFVCVPEDCAGPRIRSFGTFTEDLEAIAAWLKECRVSSLAMESTGLYWLPLHQVLNAHGITVVLVNARHVKHVPGRKSDVLDCEWIQYLHSVGLLRGSFRPADELCALRSLVRHRESLLAQAADQIRHVHKCLDQMNLQVHHVINDLSGASGQAIIAAIVAGERDAAVLAQLGDYRLKASEETLRKSLQGDWRAEHLLVLGMAHATWEHLRKQIMQLDEEIARRVKMMESSPGPAPVLRATQGGRKASRSANAPALDLSAEYARIFGTDLTLVPGLNELSVQAVLCEVGPDLSKFRSAEAFCAWLRVCPGTKISGGKRLDTRSGRGKPRLALHLRQAALGLHRSPTVPGVRYRRLRARLGAPKALTAMANLLARIIYTLITRRVAYDESIFQAAEEKHQQRQLQRLRHQAKTLGFELTAAAA